MAAGHPLRPSCLFLFFSFFFFYRLELKRRENSSCVCVCVWKRKKQEKKKNRKWLLHLLLKLLVLVGGIKWNEIWNGPQQSQSVNVRLLLLLFHHFHVCFRHTHAHVCVFPSSPIPFFNNYLFTHPKGGKRDFFCWIINCHRPLNHRHCHLVIRVLTE